MHTPDITFGVHTIGVVIEGYGQLWDIGDLGFGAWVTAAADHGGKLAFSQGRLRTRETGTPTGMMNIQQ